MKFYSEQTKKMYDSQEELLKAEKEFSDKKDKEQLEIDKAKQAYESAIKKVNDLKEAAQKLQAFILEEKEKFDNEAKEKMFDMQRKVSQAEKEEQQASDNLHKLTKEEHADWIDTFLTMLELFRKITF